MPHRPMTTDGTAASMSTREPIGVRIAGGASSERKRPIAIDSGAESRIAPNDVTTVPMMKSRAPNSSKTAFHWLCQRKPRWNARIAGHAPAATRQTIAATTSTARNAANAVKPYRTPSPMRSPRRRVRGSPAGTDAASTAPAFQPRTRTEGRVTTPSHDVHILCTPRADGGRDTPLVSSMSTIAVPQTQVPPAKGDVVFDVSGLTVHYGKATAVKDVSLAIREHAITALIGPSGCGKSTVLRCLNRMNDLVPIARIDGSVMYHGVDPIEVRRRIGMVFQRPNPFPKSIYDNVAYGLRIHGMKDNLDDRVEQALRGAALWDEVKNRLKRSALGLSGGQQQRLCIARAIAVQPYVILLDEPASALDPIS